MIPAPIPADEKERLRELYSLELLDTPYEKEFDDIVRIASKICNAPISTITLIDSDRQWFKAKVGVQCTSDPRSITFCGHAIMDDKLMEVNNALQDDRFFDNPLVLGDPPNIRYYAGMPLITQSGYKIGTLCVIDRVPRNLDADQLYSLETLAKQVMRLIELRVQNKELAALADVKNRIISIIGHDVRNPLSSIKGILDIKAMGHIPADEEEKIFGMLTEQVDCTLSMLTNLAQWGRLDVVPHKRDINAIELFSIVENCVDELALGINAKGNKIKNETDLMLCMRIDTNSLRFMLRNLITNANKFTENGFITITNTKNTITIADTGRGMDGDQVAALVSGQNIYSTTGTKNERGVGVGLMLVQDFLHKIDGKLSIKSSLGKGTSATIIVNGFPE